MSFENTYLTDLVKSKRPLNETIDELKQRVGELESAKDTMAQGIEMLLKGLKMAYKDIDLEDDNIRETPTRMARAIIEVCSGLGTNEQEVFAQTFPAPLAHEPIILKNIEFTSICSHHFFPFYGVAHIGYIPNHSGRVLGLSKLARVVDIFAQRPQLQEKMGHEIQDAIQRNLNPEGVIVVLEGKHGCLNCRGAKKRDSIMKTVSASGIFSDSKSKRNEFLNHIYSISTLD